MAGLARSPSEAIFAVVRGALDLPGHVVRVSDKALFERPIVITNTAYRFMVLEQLAEIGLEADVLLEPMRRDSGPAIAAGAAFAQMRDKDAIVLALAADHVVRDTDAFVPPAAQGWLAAEAGRIVTFGVQPERAGHRIWLYQSGRGDFGRSSRSRRNSSRSRIRRPLPSTSRPAISGTAATSCSAPRCCLTNTATSMPDSVQAVTDAVVKAGRDLGFVTLDPEAFGAAKAISIDYAVMEKTARAAVVPVRLRLVRCRLLACGVGIVRQGRATATRRKARRCSRIPAIATSRPTGRWWRWKASTISWWWRRRMPCWCRARRMPTD